MMLPRWVPTIACGQRVAPPVILLADQGFLMTESIARVKAKRNGGADGEVLAVTEPVDWNSRIQAGVGVHCHTYTAHFTALKSVAVSELKFSC